VKAPTSSRVNPPRPRIEFVMPQHRIRRLLTLAFAATLACPSVAPAQPTAPPTEPSTTTTPASQPVRATITAVRGIVEVKLTEGANWQAAKPEMVVEEGAEFRTGPRSAVQFVIPPDQTITLDRLGTVKLLTAIRQATGKTKTDLGMKYGRTRYDIAAGGIEHDSTIRSPNSTLAVRGTMVSLQDERPFAPQAVSLTGTAQFNAFKKQAVAFGGRNKAKVEGDKNSAAESAFDESFVDPSLAFARDAAEQQLVATLISQGAVVSLDRSSGIKVVRGGTVPTDAQLPSLLPGDLNFVLRWQGNANLDLLVGTSPSNEIVYPLQGLNRSKSGGSTAFDHQGGPNGGIEIISWPQGFPRETYIPGANHVSGPTVPANLQVYRNGSLCTIQVLEVIDGQGFLRQVGCLVVGNDPQTGQPIYSSNVDFNVAPPRLDDPRLTSPGSAPFDQDLTATATRSRGPSKSDAKSRPQATGRRSK
jgi:hypothetical protein